MRFHVVRDRSVTFGFLAVAACGLGITACASQAAPGAASSATSPANNTTSPSSASAADTGACVTSQLKNQPHQHRRSGGPSRRLPEVHQQQRYPMSHDRLACVIGLTARDRRRACGTAIEHVRRLALQCPATCGSSPARRFRLRDCGSRR
jgi:hypothetical protein